MSPLVLEIEGAVPPPRRDLHYIDHPMDVPAGVGALELSLAFDKIIDVLQLYAAVFEPGGRFRGHVQCPGGPGPRDLAIRIAARGDATSPGCVAGPIPAGRWTVRIDLDRHKIAAPFRLAVRAIPATADDDAPEPTTPTRAAPASTGGPGWYRGDLHCHSHHSDGRTPVCDLVGSAQALGFDYLAITDHFTSSHWRDLDVGDGPPLIMLHSIELTSHRGHANLHGLREWVDVYIDRPERTIGQVCRDVHDQGGLVCVNHAFSGDQAWSRFDTDWSAIDLLEIHHLQQGSNNDAQVGLWDRLLAAGHRVIGVGASDCHDPHEDRQALGHVVTVVRAEAGNEAGIVAGLRRGEVYVSRGADVAAFVADAEGDDVPMGGRAIAPGGRVALRVEVKTPEPAIVFVIRDGLLLTTRPLIAGGPDWQRLELEDVVDRPAWYRVEVHAAPGDDPAFWATCLRDHRSMRAMGNPIWVVPG